MHKKIIFGIFKSMGINWQEVFYFTGSLVMIVTLVIYIWLIWLFFTASQLIRNFKKSIKLKILEFLLKIIGKRTKEGDNP